MAKNDLTNSRESEDRQETGEELHIVIHISHPNSWNTLKRLFQKADVLCELHDEEREDANGNLLLHASHDK